MYIKKTPKSCCFFGHRKIAVTPALTQKLKDAVEMLIREKAVTQFYFGSNSAFDDLCHKVVTELKETYPRIRRIYVRSSFPNMDEGYRVYLSGLYEDTYFPPQIWHAGKASYLERNREMIDRSCVCLVYYDENYMPPRSGTKLAYDYAERKGCEIINLFTKE